MSSPRFTPDRRYLEYDDPENEAATEARIRPLVEPHGAKILGVYDLPAAGTQIIHDGIPWELSVLDGGNHPVPQSVLRRLNAVEAAGVNFMWFVWGEEQPVRPQFTSFPDDEPVSSRSRTKNWKQALWDAFESDTWRDPLLIGVVATGPRRGVWVLLGKWFH